MAAPARDAWATRALWLIPLATVVFLPGGSSRWVLPKLLVAVVAVGCALLAPAAGRLPRWWLWCLGLGSAVLLVASLASESPVAAVVGRWPRYEGLVAVPVYAALVWAGARLLGPGVDRRLVMARRGVFVRAIAWCAVALGFVAALEAAGLRPISSDALRPGSLTGSATDQALLGVTFAAVLVGALSARASLDGWSPRDSRTLVLWVGLLGALAAVVLSASRAGLAALAIAMVVLAAVGVLGRSGPRSWLLPALVVGVGAVAALLVPLTRGRVLGTADLQAGLSDRPLIWGDVWAVLREQWWLGWGPSGLADAVGSAHSQEWYDEVGPFMALDSPHNVVLQVWGAGGVALVVLALVAVGLAARAGWRVWREADADGRAWVTAAGAAVVAVVAGLMVSVTSPAVLAIPLVLAGALIAAPPAHADRLASDSAETPTRAWLRPAAWASVAVWAFVLATATAAELPFARGEQGGDVAALETAQTLRPWDSDTTGNAAQVLAGVTDAGGPGAATAGATAVTWADAALSRTPGSVEHAKARAVALDATDPVAAAANWETMAEWLPRDWWVAQRHALALATVGETDGALLEAERAVALAPDNADLADLVAALEARSAVS
ncbi:O-antigen ligase family protein [Demequina sp. NBRC 110051]|uniref:O-antigen ligase family protein n=1 Tax=Demequina sp. NBRC 110051 TaxID=1570340 RepID=UPI0013562A95|nr:O-antigen ligase family protein [Demequina sp. NBRC 110051]